MAFDARYRPEWDSTSDSAPDRAARGPAPGKRTLTQRLSPSGPPVVVLRVESAEAARELAGLFGPRDPNGVASGADAAVERAAGTSGHALPAPLRERFESSLGADLSAVRVHTGDDSAAAAGAVGARAYTIGNDIYFASGEYDPGSAAGQHLLAHEVAHTVQQAGSSPRRQDKLAVSSPADAAEREADAAADAMVAGAAFALGSAAPAIARKDEAKDDKKEEKPKFPKWVGDKDTVDLPLKTGTLTLDMSENPGAKMGWKGEVSHDFFDIKHTLNPPPMIAPGVMIDAAVAAKAGLSVSGEAGVKAGWEDAPGPRVEPTKQFTVSGFASGKVSLGVEGSVKLGVSAGVPMGRIAGGAELALEASAAMTANLIAGGTRNPDGFWSGNIQLIVGGEAKLEAKGSLYVDAVIATDRYNLYTYEIGSHTIGSASIACIAMVDLATGKPVDLPPVISYQWNGLPKGREIGKRKLSEEEKQKYLPVNDGASGAPSHVPDEVECENDGSGGAASDCGPPPAPRPEPAPAPAPAPSPSNDGGGGAGGAGPGNDGAHGNHG
jgi:hypothetical protein